jgi:hypothetical protein
VGGWSALILWRSEHDAEVAAAASVDALQTLLACAEMHGDAVSEDRKAAIAEALLRSPR